MLKKLLLGLLSAFIALALFFPGLKASSVSVDLPPGAGAREVSSRLAAAGVLTTRWPFLVLARLTGRASRFQPGRYLFPRWRGTWFVMGDIVAGRSVRIRLIVPEGFASWQIAERIEAQRLGSAELFRVAVASRSLGGFLFPATYELDLGLSEDQIASRLVADFERRWTPDMEKRAAEMKWSRNQVVTLASIVEREVRVAEEAPQVAAVYRNRLRIGMPLQADPTVQFAMGEWKPRLTYADYRNTRSPYNTYLNRGLPPGPICSPGTNSIRAALWPAETKALYFVAAGDGRHLFSESYRDHTNKVNRRNRERRAAPSN